MKRITNKRAGVFLCLALSLGAAQAQQTSKLLDPYRTYHSARELLEHKKYASAQLLFDQIAAYVAPVGDQEIFLYQAESEYYAAICAVALNNPDAENMMLAFVMTIRVMRCRVRQIFNSVRFTSISANLVTPLIGLSR
jgi:hypothetical protein